MKLQPTTFDRFLSKRITLPWSSSSTLVAQRQGLLRIIAVAIEEKIPLAPLLEAWTEDQWGPQYRRMRRLVRLLNQGVSLADAVEQVPGILRDEDILAIRFDAQSGTTTTAIREALDDPANNAPERPSRFRSTNMYLSTVLLLGLPVVAFIVMRIVPAFRQIFQEFRLQIPAVTETYVWLCDLFANYASLLVLALLVAFLSFVFARPGRFARREMARFVGPLRARRTAGLLRLIAIASSAGRPMAGALSTLARYHFDSTLRNKLLFVRNEVEQGANLWQSMGAVALLNDADVRALNLSERLGNRTWVLRQLANAKNRRAVRRLDYLSQLALPAVVLLMGLFVLFQALAIMTPLANIVQRLAA